MTTNYIDYNELSHDARRALEKEREKRIESVHEVDRFLQILESADELVSNANEYATQLVKQREENEILRQQLKEEKEARAKVEMQLNEMNKLSAGVAKKSSQEGLEKAFRIYINTSKRKTQAKREVARAQLLDFITTAKLEMPEDIMEMLNHLDDEQPDAKVVNVQGNYNDIHNNETVNSKA
ncbi:MAG: hypothetical protein J6W52_09005 [Bacteroidaceae bacterium]|nr:hypothetical protein [Bacteroidaceae bacterium]